MAHSMKTINYLLTPLIFLFFNCKAQDTIQPSTKDTLIFSGQLSAWGLYNQDNNLPAYLSVRYIPTLNYTINLQNNRKLVPSEYDR